MLICSYPQLFFPGENTLFSSVARFQLGFAKPLCWRVRTGPRAALDVVSSLCVSLCSGDIPHPWLCGLGLPSSLPAAETAQLSPLQ